MNVKTNLITSQFITTKVGLTFLFITVISLGFALLASGALAIISRSERRALIEASQSAWRANSISAVVSNEKANPGIIAFYLNDAFAGAIPEDGEYSPAADAPPEGPLAIRFVNPVNTALPTTAEFPAQTLTLTADTGTLRICTPRMTGDKTLWVSKSGSTFYNSFLTERARSC